MNNQYLWCYLWPTFVAYIFDQFLWPVFVTSFVTNISNVIISQETVAVLSSANKKAEMGRLVIFRWILTTTDYGDS